MIMGVVGTDTRGGTQPLTSQSAYPSRMSLSTASSSNPTTSPSASSSNATSSTTLGWRVLRNLCTHGGEARQQGSGDRVSVAAAGAGVRQRTHAPPFGMGESPEDMTQRATPAGAIRAAWLLGRVGLVKEGKRFLIRARVR
ncbi:MAG: hypothetical protein WDW38_004336 [Sanguina aurantia]